MPPPTWSSRSTSSGTDASPTRSAATSTSLLPGLVPRPPPRTDDGGQGPQHQEDGDQPDGLGHRRQPYRPATTLQRHLLPMLVAASGVHRHTDRHHPVRLTGQGCLGHREPGRARTGRPGPGGPRRVADRDRLDRQPRLLAGRQALHVAGHDLGSPPDFDGAGGRHVRELLGLPAGRRRRRGGGRARPGRRGIRSEHGHRQQPQGDAPEAPDSWGQQLSPLPRRRTRSSSCTDRGRGRRG